MRYSLLNYLVCTHCRGDLISVVRREVRAPMPPVTFAPFDRVPSEGALVGPLPSTASRSALAALVSPYACDPAPSERNFEVDLEEGVLLCLSCERWYPIIRSLPEMLPDHLRDDGRDREYLAQLSTWLPEPLYQYVANIPRVRDTIGDTGAHYKRAEMSLQEKLSNPTYFYGPGYTSPFNLWDPDFTTYLIRLFAEAMPLLALKRGQVVLDSGSGYSWTTEWLFRSGFEAIGVDITRVYMDIGVVRMREMRPHLIVADIEHLPIRDNCIDAVLAFESFHHVPDRRAAMAGFCRALQERGTMVLAEPGSDHEDVPPVKETMKKYGILEKGMELEDVEKYVNGLSFDPPEQLYAVRVAASELASVLDPLFVRRHRSVVNNIFRVRKSQTALRIKERKGVRKRMRKAIWRWLKVRVRDTAERLDLE